MESNKVQNNADQNKEPLFSKKEITNLALRSTLLQASFNFERMQAGGWTLSMLPNLQKIFKDDKKALSDSMVDNMEFINTHPNLVGFLMGLLISLEENKQDRSIIKGLKVALFGPLAGIGDAIFWFTILPIVAGICSSFAQEKLIIGPIIFFLVYLGIFILRIVWTHMGYNLGTKAIDVIKDNSQIVGKAATILGVTVIGALVANYVNIEVLSSLVVNEEKTVFIQADFFDKIFPNLLPMAYTLLMFYFLKKKNVKPTTLIIITFVLCIVLSILGIL